MIEIFLKINILIKLKYLFLKLKYLIKNLKTIK